MKKPVENGTTDVTFEVKNAKCWSNGGVTFNLIINGVTIYGCRVVESKNGDFMSFPQRKGNDGKYYHIAYCKLDNETQAAILKEVERQLNA